MTLNTDLVRSRCADIEDAVVRLERFGAMSVDEFIANPESVDAACFDTLCVAGIVPDDLAGRLKAMARFRNLLVHMYKRVEPAAVHDLLRNSLPDLRAFAAAVVRLI